MDASMCDFSTLKGTKDKLTSTSCDTNVSGVSQLRFIFLENGELENDVWTTPSMVAFRPLSLLLEPCRLSKDTVV